jgi:hypothetical protein
MTTLDDLTARRAALAERTAARLEYTDEELVAIEERRIAELEALDAAQTQYGARTVRMVTTDDAAVIVRRPHHAAFRKFMDKGEVTSTSQEELALSCLVYPSKAEFDKLLRAQTGALIRIANACVELAGFRTEELKTK